jgi:hypothetical protein
MASITDLTIVNNPHVPTKITIDPPLPQYFPGMPVALTAYVRNTGAEGAVVTDVQFFLADPAYFPSCVLTSLGTAAPALLQTSDPPAAFTIAWATPSPIDTFLYAQAQAIQAAGADPCDTSRSYNARKHFQVVANPPVFAQDGYEVRTVGVPDEMTLFGALGVVNPESSARATGIVLESLAQGDERSAEAGSVGHLLSRGHWLQARRITLTLGKESIVRRPGAHVGALGHVGALARRVFDTLKAEDREREELSMELGGHQIRQVLFKIEPPSDARPEDFYVLAVRHGAHAGRLETSFLVVRHGLPKYA